MKIAEGSLTSKGKKYAIIASRFNDFVTTKLLEGALSTLKKHGVQEKEILVCWVPGSFEIPATAQRLAKQKKHSAILCLGALIAGETPHFDYIASSVSHGLIQVGVENQIPVIFGVLTCNTVEQALERAGGKMGNKGEEAALTALQMAQLFSQLKT